MAPPGGRQHAFRGTCDELPRIQDHRGATRQGEVAFTVAQAVTGQVHCGQTGRACGVHRERGTVDAQGVRDPPGCQAEAAAGESIRRLHGVRIGGQQLIVAVRQTHEHTGERVGHGRRSQAGVLDGLPGGFQQQPVLGSIAVASRSLIPKNSQSKPATSSRNPPHFVTDRPGTPG